MKKIFLLLYLLAIVSPNLFSAIIVNSFAPTTFNANTSLMDQTLGVTGFTIENFEDNNFVDGLTISANGSTPFSQAPPVNFGSSLVWDGTLGIDAYNSLGFPAVTVDTMTFHLAQGASSFGFGTANMEIRRNPDLNIVVNGVTDLGPISEMPGYFDTIVTGSQRNIYVRLDAVGETINTVTINWGPTVSLGLDNIVFDHVAFNTAPLVPEPTTFGLILIGLVGFIYTKKS